MTAQVEMQYLGHSSFLWMSPSGTRVVIDPYDNTHPHGWRWFLRTMPALDADVVLVTHDHFDHNAVHRVGGEPHFVLSAGEIEIDDVKVAGFEDRHASPDDIANTIFVVDAGGVRFCHLGDNRADIPQHTVDAIGAVDVLIVPVDDSSHLLRFWEVRQLIEGFDPRVVVPVHYLVPGLTDPGSTLLPADTWLATQPRVKRLEASSVELGAVTLPSEREVWVFETQDE